MAAELPTTGTESAATNSTADLVQRIALGDPAAEQELCHRYRRVVWLLAQRQCRAQPNDAEDLTQEVLAQVIERLRSGELRDSANLPHYLRQAIHNRCLLHFRTLESKPSGPLHASAEPSDPDGSPLQRILRNESRMTLLRLLRDLPRARDRELLYRFYAEQQDREQICRELDIEPLHFRKVLSRARLRMRELIDRAGLQRVDTDP